MKKIAVCGIVLCFTMMLCSISFASPFIEQNKLNSNAMYAMKNKGPVNFSYHTPDGQFKVKLSYPHIKGKMIHAEAWMNDSKVYDYNLPAVDNGYMTRIYKDMASNRIFISFSSYKASILVGYNGNSKKVETYVDSHNYYSGFAWAAPWLYSRNNGDLVLCFLDGYDDVPAHHKHIYVLDWDESAQWFNYRDEGISAYNRD